MDYFGWNQNNLRSGVKNIEFKARCTDLTPIRAYLELVEARYVGEDHQLDTYFHVPAGRLKLREGTIERSLIFYQRPNQAGPKQSDVKLHRVEEDTSATLRGLLAGALGIKVVVDKRRHIYFIDNVKIHLDEVEGLGTFLEVEAIDRVGDVDAAFLLRQCEHLLTQFSVAESDLITHSYSDLLLEKRKNMG